ncbi:MAG: methyltransferase [Massilibacteroides sp.]|nr:methyltransferase [Massilibacteroides sp.]MDD4659683.1 methyltransferase [Massilibacteroides sp.]
MKKKIVIFFALLATSMGMWAQRPNASSRNMVPPLLQDMMNKSYLPYIIKMSAEAGVFDALRDKTLTVTEFSEMLKTREVVSDALLGVLVAAELINYNDGKYSLSQTASDYLVAQSPKSQLVWLNENAPMPFREMTGLKEALFGVKKKTDKGEEMNEKENSSIGMWQDKEKLIATKNQRLKDKQTQIIIDFLESLPEFDNCRKMIDYAGSIGYYSMAILNKNSALKAYVYDLPEVCEIALDVQKDEKNFNRVTFCPFDMRKDNSFGEGYDLFFVSNALYGNRTKEKLVDFFKKANQSMKMDGVLVSNHWMIQHGKNYVSTTITELKNSFSGRPVHYIEEEILKQVLAETGFDNYTVKIIDEQAAKPRLLIAARKVKNL